MSRIDFIVLPYVESLKILHLLSGKLRTEFTGPIAKSTSPGLSLDADFTTKIQQWTKQSAGREAYLRKLLILLTDYTPFYNQQNNLS